MKYVKHLGLFLSGMFIAFDFTGLIGRSLIANTRPTERKSDLENITADWNNVGTTLQKVMKHGKQK